jgi:hypothetical protein
MELNITKNDNTGGESSIGGQSSTSRVPLPRITTMAHKNRGSLAHPLPEQPKRQVTYDDILSSLNMKVVDGKLQIVRNTVAESIKTNNFDNLQQQMEKQQQQSKSMMVPETPPITREQYKQIQVANYLKAVQQQQHIRNVKSTKMKFF